MSVRVQVNEWDWDVGVERLREGETVCVAGFATGARNGKGGLAIWGLGAAADMG